MNMILDIILYVNITDGYETGPSVIKEALPYEGSACISKENCDFNLLCKDRVMMNF